MTTPQHIADTILDLSDVELFATDEAPLTRRELPLMDEPFEGLALVGPARVSLASQAALPLVLGQRQTGHRAWAVPRDANTALVAFDRDTREVRVAAMFPDDKLREHPPSEPPGRGPAPDPSRANSVIVGLDRVDARARLDLPWRASRLRLWAVAFDWVSNPVDVVLEGPTPIPPHPAAPPQPPPAAPDPDGGAALPSYAAGEARTSDRGPSAFDTADATVLELTLPQLAFDLRAEPGEALELSGSFTVEGEPGLIPAALHPGQEGSIAATVPLTFALFALDVAVPFRADLVVPVHGAALAAPGAHLTGYFRLPFAAASPSPPPPGVYRVYAVIEGLLVGPADLLLR